MRLLESHSVPLLPVAATSADLFVICTIRRAQPYVKNIKILAAITAFHFLFFLLDFYTTSIRSAAQSDDEMSEGEVLVVCLCQAQRPADRTSLRAEVTESMSQAEPVGHDGFADHKRLANMLQIVVDPHHLEVADIIGGASPVQNLVVEAIAK